MSVWAYRCTKGPSSSPCIPKMLEASSTKITEVPTVTQELWWEHEKKTDRILHLPRCWVKDLPARQSSGPCESWVAPDLLRCSAHMCSHASHAGHIHSEAKVQNRMFTSLALHAYPWVLSPSFPWRQPCLLGPESRESRKPDEKKNKVFSFSQQWGWLHFASSLPWLWPGIPGCLACASGSLLPLEVHCNCCHNTTASTFGENTNPAAKLPVTKHNAHTPTVTDENRKATVERQFSRYPWEQKRVFLAVMAP